MLRFNQMSKKINTPIASTPKSSTAHKIIMICWLADVCTAAAAKASTDASESQEKSSEGKDATEDDQKQKQEGEAKIFDFTLPPPPSCDPPSTS